MKALIILFLSLSVAVAYAGGGDDHTHAPTEGTGANVRSTPTHATATTLTIVSYPGNLEVFVKYPPPHLDEPVIGRIFFADYASNHPVNPTGIELSFPGALGAKVVKQPTKISDGVYEFTALFVRDTNHTALLRYTTGEQEQLASLSPFYAGSSADRVLAPSSGTSVHGHEGFSFSTWMLLPLVAAAIMLAYFLAKRKYVKTTVVSTPTVTTIDKRVES